MILISLCILLSVKNFADALINVKLSNPPLVYPTRQYIIVDSYTNLTLGCRGTEPIQWTFNNSIPINSNVKESSPDIIEQGYKYESILTVFNVTYLNVGFYYCHSKLVNYNTPTRSNKIYVFVSDDKHLTVLSKSQYYYSDLQNSELTLPCRPSSPDVSVTLIRQGFYTKKKIVIEANGYYKIQHFQQTFLSGQFNSFDGFLLTDFRKSKRVEYTCIFTKFNVTKTVTYSFIRGNFYEFFKQEAIPYVDEPDFIVKYLGENLTLQCSIIIDMVTFESLSWVRIKNLKIYDLKAEKTQTFELKNFKLLIATITVNNITFRDEGFYRCDKDKNPFPLRVGTYVTVFDRNKNYSPPKIFPNEDIQINAGNNLTVTCKGRRPVQWGYSQLGHEIGTNNIIVNEQNISIYVSYLHITNARYKDTNLYYCYDISSDPEAFNPFKSSKIYVFVKDESNLFLTRTSKSIPYTQYSNITIPCLPTSPDVSVELRQYISEKQEVTPVILKYDPRIGYVVNMTYNFELYTFCYFKYKNQTSFLDMYHPYYENVHFNLKFLIISPPRELVFMGSNLELHCRIAVPNYISADNIQWILPIHLNSTRISIKSSIVPVKDGKVLLSHLTVKTVENIDEGWYKCILRYNNEKEIEAKKFISVYDEFDVNPVIGDLKYNQSLIGQKLILQCTVNIEHNIDLDISWTAPNMSEFRDKNIPMKTKTNYIPNLLNIRAESKLVIQNVTKENQGNYTCNVKDSTQKEKMFSKEIRVRSGKKAKIIKSNLNASKINTEIDNNITLVCPAYGDPLPTITWKKNETIIETVGKHINLSPNKTELKIYFLQPTDQGFYTCTAENPLGLDVAIFNLFVTPIKTNRTTYIIVIIIVSIMIIIMTIINGIKIRNDKKLRKILADAGVINFETGEIQYINPNLNIAEQAIFLPYDKKWEIPRNKINLGQTLGCGNFGLVVEATVTDFFEEDPHKIVAVKTLKPSSNFMDLNALISELKIMIHIGKHVNIINLLGACTQNIAEKKLLVVVEYCKFGNLRDYLLNNRDNFVGLVGEDCEDDSKSKNFSDTISTKIPNEDNTHELEDNYHQNEKLTTDHLICWAFQIARGMDYLASRKIFHGDLAARNILLTDENVVKVSDFGLSRTLYQNNVYKKKVQCPLPIKWMAIESIRDKTFSTQSDVWSYGIVLWELFSLAQTPYPDMEPNLDFFRYLDRGNRMSKPKYASKQMYQIMLDCWQMKPNCRPTFRKLIDAIGEFLEDNIRKHYIDLNEPYEKLNAELLSGKNDYLTISPADDYQNISTCIHVDENDEKFEKSDDIPMTVFNYGYKT